MFARIRISLLFALCVILNISTQNSNNKKADLEKNKMEDASADSINISTFHPLENE